MLQQALGFKPNPDALRQGILAGGGWTFGGVWVFPTRFFFPWASSSHGSSTTVGSYMGGNRNPMKATWGLLSIHPAPLPCGAMPGGARPLPAPRKAPVCECGGTQGTCRKLCGIAEDGKIPKICPFSEKTSELGGVFLSIQSARLLGNFLRRLWL